jgi:hypothetical protein
MKVGAIPPATVTAKALNASSMPGAAAGDANAAASAPESVAPAAETVVEGGTTPLA